MVFGWIVNKYKRWQLQKAQIQAEADHMAITDGVSILNPKWRMFFTKMPFYDKKTDSVDFRELDKFIGDIYLKGNHDCDGCVHRNLDCLHLDDLCKIPRWQSQLEAKDMDYASRVELEHLRKLFKILTGEDEYFYPSDFQNMVQIIKDYRDQYRNLDETISNFENKIYQKNEEIERLQSLLDEKPVEKEVIKFIPKENSKDSRLIKRGSKIYLKFRESVLKRDKVCQCCGNTENLHVHHLSSFKLHNSRGADVDNGIVLCEECHNHYHSIYGKSHDNNPVNFSKFLREQGKPMQVSLDNILEDDRIYVLDDYLGGK